MFASHEDLEIVRYEGYFDPVKQGLAALKPFEFIDEPTVICDLSSIISRVRLWQHHLPRVTLSYPVGINSDPLVLRVLDRIGVKFSCSSKDEIRSMRLKGVLPDDILYANTVKIISHLRCAQKQQVATLVVDCLDELEKVKMYHPEAKLILKINFNDSTDFVAGCDPKTDALKLMMEAKNMDLNLVGISFDNNISREFNPENYKSMLITTRTLFDYGRGILGLQLNTIGIGGGLPATIDSDTFSHFSAVINKIMAELFADPSIKVMAEPAEFLVAPSMTLFATVQARKDVVVSVSDNDHKMFYYVNWSMSSLEELTPKWIIDEGIPQEDNTVYPSIILGASSRSEQDNVITRSAAIPIQFVGDVLYFENVGAFPLSANTGGFRAPCVKYFLKDTCKIIL